MTPTLDDFTAWVRRIVGLHAPTGNGEVFQTSTIGALLDGVFDGDVTIAELLRHGDFGLGTFNRLDGEMVVLDGVCYHLHADGTAQTARPDDRTPFAAVTRFHADRTLAVSEPSTRADVLAVVDDAIASPNLIYAVRLTGTFSRVRTRTVGAQTPPYRSLTAASDEQAEKVFDDVEGIMVGFRTPAFEQGISVAGYHLHFLDADRTAGGHVLNFTLRRGEIALSGAAELHLRLPTTGAFLTAQLSADDVDAKIQHAEGGT
jgi:acetolactate decarboxylase